MGIELEVSTRQSESYPGDTVEGAVTLTVSAVSSCLSCCAGVGSRLLRQSEGMLS